jgi:hypothetical protein
MKRATYILALLAIIAATVYAVHRALECNARGGVMVKGLLDYVCVTAARVAP